MKRAVLWMSLIACVVTVAPALLGSGEQLFAATNLLELGYECCEHVMTANVSHFVVTKTAS